MLSAHLYNPKHLHVQIIHKIFNCPIVTEKEKTFPEMIKLHRTSVKTQSLTKVSDLLQSG